MDGALVGASSMQPYVQALRPMQEHQLEKKTFTSFKPITHQVKLKILAINILFKVSSNCTCLLKKLWSYIKGNRIRCKKYSPTYLACAQGWNFFYMINQIFTIGAYNIFWRWAQNLLVHGPKKLWLVKNNYTISFSHLKKNILKIKGGMWNLLTHGLKKSCLGEFF